jgi:hypothetical protein
VRLVTLLNPAGSVERAKPKRMPPSALRAPTGERATALVFGAQSGIHLVRVTDSPTRLAADLTRGPLQIVALHTLQLDASNLGDPWVLHLAASGPVLQLRRDGPSVSVRTGF